MLRTIAPLIVPIAMLAVVACSGRHPVDDQANDAAGLPASRENAPDATGAPPANKANPATSATAASAARIPAALYGRWGLAPNDCTSTRGDAKGLLLITPAELRFYESRAVPGSNTSTRPDSISGSFTFTGEGQTWSKFIALQIQKDGLVRTESNPSASFTYAKCK